MEYIHRYLAISYQEYPELPENFWGFISFLSLLSLLSFLWSFHPWPRLARSFSVEFLIFVESYTRISLSTMIQQQIMESNNRSLGQSDFLGAFFIFFFHLASCGHFTPGHSLYLFNLLISRKKPTVHISKRPVIIPEIYTGFICFLSLIVFTQLLVVISPLATIFIYSI